MTTTLKTTLLLIDCQKDFHPGGSLAIPKADDDAERIAQLIRRLGGGSSGSTQRSGESPTLTVVDRIVATLDTHQKLHIAHPCFWISGNDNDNTDNSNKHPDPFTIISAKDVKDGIWKPRSDLKAIADDMSDVLLDASIFENAQSVMKDDTTSSRSSSGSANLLDLNKYCVEYTSRLEQKGRFKLCIWPEHCLIGSNGHAVVDSIQQALHEWSAETGHSVEWILKGQHMLTEMYSALEADVPVSKSTAFNESLFQSLRKSDRLLVCGQAMSHCVNYTLRDIVSRWPVEERSKIVLLTDCASPVPGFEDAAIAFQQEMQAAGVLLKKSSEVE